MSNGILFYNQRRVLLKTAILAFLYLFSHNIYADPWEDLTLDEAEEVKAYLKKNPFILDYCDCCNYKGEYAAKVFLRKVRSYKIVPCDWAEGKYSVKTITKRIAQLPYSESGVDYSNPVKASGLDETSIDMNYTWSFNKDRGAVLPLYSSIDYHQCQARNCQGDIQRNIGQCRKPTYFPNPFRHPDVIIDSDYKEWYSKTVLKKAVLVNKFLEREKQFLSKNENNSGKYLEFLDAELNKAYKTVRSALTEKQQQRLKQSQLKWLKFRDAEFDLVNRNNSFGNSRATIVRDRVLQLANYAANISSTTYKAQQFLENYTWFSTFEYNNPEVKPDYREFTSQDGNPVKVLNCLQAKDLNPNTLKAWEFSRFGMLATECYSFMKSASATSYRQSYFPKTFSAEFVLSLPALTIVDLSGQLTEEERGKGKSLLEFDPKTKVIKSSAYYTRILIEKDMDIGYSIMARGDLNGDGIEDIILKTRWSINGASGNGSEVITITKKSPNAEIEIIDRFWTFWPQKH